MRLRENGAKPCHEEKFLRGWSGAFSCKGMSFPGKLVEHLPEIESDLERLAKLRSIHPAAEGVARLLVEFSDGQFAESVLLPRGGLCVSTQVGCAVGCVFCMSGKGGLSRHLGSAEIVAQVVLARKIRHVSKVVFMGMGEPAHNLDNVIEAIAMLGKYGGIGHKNLVLSTVGDPRIFGRLPSEEVKPALAISLHSSSDELRRKLLPRAPGIPVAKLVEAAEDYARLTHYPTQYQWTLLEGINDGDDEMNGIVRLLSGKYAIMNFIPFNSAEGLEYERPSRERIVHAVGVLRNAGIAVRVRDSAGQEIEGACGQLRARSGALAREELREQAQPPVDLLF